MIGHEGVKVAVRDYLHEWVPIRLELIRMMLDVDAPIDPQSYRLSDHLPNNDASQYPAVVVQSTRTVGWSKRQASGSSEVVVMDVDYEVTVVVAAEYSDYADEETAVLHRDRILLAVRECVLLPGSLGNGVEILSVSPDEVTGAASETLRGNSLAAGQITFIVRAAEALMPTTTLQSIVAGTVTVTPVDASASLPTP